MSQGTIHIEKTDDGSSTLYIPEMDEHYHSIKGAITESAHIFIELGFKKSFQNPLHILEIGFGTGLNAYLTLIESVKSNRRVHYTGLELYPLSWEIVARLEYTNDPHFKTLHASSWEEEEQIIPNFTLLKKKTDFTRYAIEGEYDLVYFDAFAPEKQPQMWAQALFTRLYEAMSKGGLLTTYCAKGVVRRMLQTAGFVVERLPGPPGGKREVLRATKK